jgi:hypothetical protein
MVRNLVTKRLTRSLVIILIALFGLQTISLASGRGKLSGRVVDSETGEPLPGVNVLIESIWVGGAPVPYDGMIGAAADLNGSYEILNVPAGTYDIRASMIGYNATVQSQVEVDAGRTIVVNFSMVPAVIELGVVEVVWERPVIQADIAGTQEIINIRRIEEVPLVRVDEFLDRIKGVELVATNEGMGLSIRGGAIRETDIRVDGISLRDPRSENSYLALNSTTIEQVQVMTGGFEAKYGGIQSGLVNFVTREGSRERYTLSLNADVTPGSQKRYFGLDPFSDDSPIYQVFAGQYAMDGIRTAADSAAVPSEFWGFRGWNDPSTGNYPELPPGATLTPEQKLELWKIRHPQYRGADRPDVFFEGSITGPMPALPRTTFLMGFRYEDSPFAFPIGPRDRYIDWNTQLKLTTRITPAIRLSVDGMYAKINSLSEGRASNYGGLLDNSASFNYLNNTSVGVRRQAGLIGGFDGMYQLFNRSKLQFFDKQYILGGIQLNHTLSQRSYYTFNVQFGYTDNTLMPFELDTTRADAWIEVGGYRFMNVPSGGSPNASTNWALDEYNFFWLYGGLQRDDQSYSWVFDIKGDYTNQLNRHNQFETGFSIRTNYLYVESGTWLQSERMWTPDTWQYYTVTPLELAAYVQDKLEFEGLIATLGARVDYFNPSRNGYDLMHPLDPVFAAFYNDVYMNLPGEWGSYERWLAFREFLENPPDWEGKKVDPQIKISPRMGVSFPVTASSKIYFNYGHFYQRQPVSFLYNLAIGPGWTSIPTPDLPMGRTVSYEFGYEQSFLESFLANVTFYYKDIRNQPLSQQYISWWRNNNVSHYVAERYEDIRGIELRLERRVGRYITFWANYDYMLRSRGLTGLQRIYENRLEASDEQRAANIVTTIPQPRSNINVTLRTPSGFGPEIGSVNLLGNIYVTFLFEWRSGGKFIWNPQEPDVKLHRWVEIVDYSNLDLRASKSLRYPFGQIEFILTVQNLLNQQRLETGNMTRNQYDAYRNAIKLSFFEGDQQGNDRWGEWDKEHLREALGWWTTPLFLNPRRVLLGVRVNL